MSTSALDRRASGILLHPTSLPGPRHRRPRRGAPLRRLPGRRRPEALAGAAARPDRLRRLALPALLGLAGNPLLIELEPLVTEEAARRRRPGAARASAARPGRTTAPACRCKRDLLGSAARLSSAAGDGDAARRSSSGSAPRRRTGCDAYALFMASRTRTAGGRPGRTGRARARPPRGRASRRPPSSCQFEFFRQWDALRDYATRSAACASSATCRSSSPRQRRRLGHRELFDLDAAGRPRTVAGVPPDYFSATGQLWGNPLYRWDVMARDGFRWWIGGARDPAAGGRRPPRPFPRPRGLLRDPRRRAPTPREGRWVRARATALLPRSARSSATCRHRRGPRPDHAGGRGAARPVRAARDARPAVRLRQRRRSRPVQPHNYVPQRRGLHRHPRQRHHRRLVPRPARRHAARRAGAGRARPRAALPRLRRREIHWDFIRAVESSVARTAIIPLQDVLGLGSEARFNTPASTAGNWSWRLPGPAGSAVRVWPHAWAT